MNINLNPGGIIGAIVLGVLGCVIIFSLVDTTTAGRGVYKLAILPFIVGAFGGNFLWAAIFPERKPKRRRRRND